MTIRLSVTRDVIAVGSSIFSSFFSASLNNNYNLLFPRKCCMTLAKQIKILDTQNPIISRLHRKWSAHIQRLDIFVSIGEKTLHRVSLIRLNVIIIETTLDLDFRQLNFAKSFSNFITKWLFYTTTIEMIRYIYYIADVSSMEILPNRFISSQVRWTHSLFHDSLSSSEGIRKSFDRWIKIYLFFIG